MKECLLHKHPAGSRMIRQPRMAAATKTSQAMKKKPDRPANNADPSINPGRELRRHAEDWLQAQQQTPQSAADTARHVHELEVHQIELERLISELQMALARVKQLSGLLPICANCKKIRDDRGYWKQVEAYIASHSEATFSHGICPECFHKLYPEFEDRAPGPATTGTPAEKIPPQQPRA